MVRLYASLICVKETSDLGSALEQVLLAGIDGLHLDVINGVRGLWPFDPEYTTKVVRYAVQTRQDMEFPLEAHLIVKAPVLAIDDFKKAGATRITLPYSNFEQYPGSLPNCLKAIKEDYKVTAVGVALSPGEVLQGCVTEELCQAADYLVVVCSGPGVDKVPMLPYSDTAISQLAGLKGLHNPQLEIIAEGGINRGNAHAIKNAGADSLVLGRALFLDNDYAGFISDIRDS